jgi:cell fate (sporulation/competence/biofilm development) regulator YmcA (YheA/YmcA/DUF963 family)
MTKAQAAKCRTAHAGLYRETLKLMPLVREFADRQKQYVDENAWLWAEVRRLRKLLAKQAEA